MQEFMLEFFTHDGTYGIARGRLNEFATTGTTSPVAVNTGVACVNGCYYKNTASVNVAIPTPVTSTRVDYIVLRYTASTTQTVRITRIAGTEGAGAPSLTQTEASSPYDVALYTASITTGGVITLTDQRRYARSPFALGITDGSTLEYDSTNKVIRVKDGGITNAKLASGIDGSKITSGSPSIAGLAIAASTGGGAVAATISNTSTSASSDAKTTISVNSGTAGDPFSIFDISGVIDWSIGVDNSDSDKFKISKAATLGTNDIVAIDTNGNTVHTGAALQAITSNAGAAVEVRAQNTSTAASSDAKVVISANSATAGDPFVSFDISGVQGWVAGVDNSDSDKFKIGTGSAPGAGDLLTITTAGVVTAGSFVGGLTGNASTATTATTANAVASNAVDTAGIQALAVTTAKIADANVTTAKITDANVTTAKLADNSVDDTKAGDRVPQFYRRQGGSATDWTAQGTSTQTPTSVRMQAGSARMTWAGVSATSTGLAITFPTAFRASTTPVVFCQPFGSTTIFASTGSMSNTGFTLFLRDSASIPSNGSQSDCMWFAVGDE